MNQNIGALSRTADYKYKPWLGFIELKQAKRLKRAKPVKLEIYATSLSTGSVTKWIKVDPGQHVQGCPVQEGACGIEGESRLL